MSDMADLDLVLVSGGIFLAIIVVPFVGYKLYQKYFTKCGDLTGCCCRRRTGSNATADVLRGFINRRPLPKIVFDFPDCLRVGETVSFRIIFPRNRQRCFRHLQNSVADVSHPQESVTFQNQHLESLSISVEKEFAGRGTPHSDYIPLVKEFLPNQNEEEDVLQISFFVRESGFYQVNVLFENQHLRGSPFPTPFNPSMVDPEKTNCLRESPTLLAVSGDHTFLNMRPRDRFGNECNFGDVVTTEFSFKVIQVDESIKGAGVEQVIYTFTREWNDNASTEFGSTRTLEVKLQAEFILPGVFQGIIAYKEVPIENGIFDIIVLSSDENEIFSRNMRENPGSRYHEAKLLALGSELQKKVRQVYVYVAPKVVSVKEFFLGVIPKKIGVFRVLPATKIQLLFQNHESGTSTMIIVDRIQRITLEMDTISSRVVMAMFAQFLKLRLGGSESFENKQKFFYEELKCAREGSMRLTSTVINIQRPAIIASTLTETKTFTSREWCKNFKIRFIGEEGADDGGLRREWLDLICQQMFENNSAGMFASLGNSRLVHPNTVRDTNKWTLKHFELAGKIVGKCLFETAIGGHYKQMVNGRFTRSFLAQIIGFTPHYKHFEQDDPELYLGKVKYILENDVLPMDLNFTEEEYNSNGQLIETIDLVPNGGKTIVTNENKEEYLNSLAQYRLSTKVKREVESFLKGLTEIVPDGLLMNFDENELEMLMCGKSKFVLEDLQSYHMESDDDANYQKIIPWFWTAITGMTDDEKARLLQFTTGSSLLPHGGFKELKPTFRITVYSDVGKLPIAHTCFNEICLSNHKSYEDFEKSLRTAINEGSEGFAIL